MTKRRKHPRNLRAWAIGIFLLAGLFLSATPSWAISQLGTIAVGLRPGPVAVNPSAHLVYVVNQNANSISILDSELLKVKKTIAVGTAPVAIAANPPEDMVYVANSGSGTISAIKGTGAAATWKVGGIPVALVVDSAVSKLYVADASLNQVEILDAKLGTVLGTLTTALTPSAMALNIATHNVFVACTGGSGSVVVIDGTKNQILTTVTGALIPTGITSISVDPATNVAIVASPTANAAIGIAVIDAANGFSVLDVPGTAGQDPISTAYDAGGIFLVDDLGDGHIAFSGGDGMITFGNGYNEPGGTSGNTAMAVNPTTNQFGIVDPKGDTLELIDLLNPLFLTVYHQLFTGLTPTGLAFDPLTSRVFVTNAGDNTVSVFDVSPRSVIPAYEGNFSNFNVGYNYLDINPATETVYTLRVGNLIATNESEAVQGSNGTAENGAGVTVLPLANASSSAVAVNAATNKIYVGDSTNAFYSVDGATNTATLLNVLPSSADIRSLAVDSATNEILAWDYHGNQLYVLDSASDTLVKTIALGTSSSQPSVLVDSGKNLVYVATNPVSVVDPVAGAVVTTIPITGAQLAAAINPAANRLYVATNSDDLFVIDTKKNSVVTDIKLPHSPESLAVNSVTGNFYVASTSGSVDVLVYSGTTNKLIVDLSSKTYPVLTGSSDIKVNPLTNTVYVGTDSAGSSTGIAVIDGRTNVVSAAAGNPYDIAAHALGVDLGSGAIAAAGYSYTTLWLPTSYGDLTGGNGTVPIAVTMQGVKDASTIATAPIFRTHNTQPTFAISAVSNFPENAAALVPKHAFYQVDGWQGTWKAVTLKAKAGASVSTGQATLAALSTGQHILYVFASDGDVATIQDGNPNSPVISPVGSVVFTVEK
jgi:YVTN family beta-propeller protein